MSHTARATTFTGQMIAPTVAGGIGTWDDHHHGVVHPGAHRVLRAEQEEGTHVRLTQQHHNQPPDDDRRAQNPPAQQEVSQPATADHLLRGVMNTQTPHTSNHPLPNTVLAKISVWLAIRRAPSAAPRAPFLCEAIPAGTTLPRKRNQTTTPPVPGTSSRHGHTRLLGCARRTATDIGERSPRAATAPPCPGQMPTRPPPTASERRDLLRHESPR